MRIRIHSPENTETLRFFVFVPVTLSHCRCRESKKLSFVQLCVIIVLLWQNPEDAVKALTTLSGLPVSNKRIKVSYSRPNTADIRQAERER